MGSHFFGGPKPCFLGPLGGEKMYTLFSVKPNLLNGDPGFFDPKRHFYTWLDFKLFCGGGYCIKEFYLLEPFPRGGKGGPSRAIPKRGKLSLGPFGGGPQTVVVYPNWGQKNFQSMLGQAWEKLKKIFLS